MINYLKNNPNLYNSYILPFCLLPGALLRKNLPQKDKNKGIDLHHIIPISSGGPDVAYNIVFLPKADHIISHYYLAKTTNKSKDHYAVKMMTQHINVESNAILTKDTVEKALELIGNYSFKKERKSVEVVDGFKKSTIDYFKGDTYWFHPDLKSKLLIKGCLVKQLKDLQSIFVEALPENSKQRKTLSNLKSRSFCCRISRLMRGVCCSLHGWVWAEPEVGDNSKNDSLNDSLQPDFTLHNSNSKNFLKNRKEVIWYHEKLDKPIKMPPLAVKAPLKTNLVNFFIAKTELQNSQVSQTIKNANPSSFCHLMLKVFNKQNKSAYGFYLDKKNLKKNNTNFLQKEMHWQHTSIHYSDSQKPLIVAPNSLRYLNSLQNLFLNHLKQLNVNAPNVLVNTKNIKQHKKQIQANINSLEKLSSDSFSAVLNKCLSPNYPQCKTVFGFQLIVKKNEE